jgi:tetratricopeptide (TPR) repeat protein
VDSIGFLVTLATFRVVAFWKWCESFGWGLVNFIGFLVTVTIFCGVVFILWKAAEPISIAPLLVPQELERSGMTSVVAAQRLRDALRRFGERANALTHEHQLALIAELPLVTVGSLHDNLPDFSVPKVGLSVEGIAAYIRSVLDRPNISGEVTLFDNSLRLRLRLNGQTFYDDRNGVKPNEMDQLFENAAHKVFDVIGPYWSTAVVAEKEPDRAIEIAKEMVLEEPKQSARWHNLIGSILHDKADVTEAEKAYRAAIADDSAFAIAHSNLAVLLFERGAIGEAADEYNKALEYAPQFAAARFNLARALRAQGKVVAADAESKRAMTEYRRTIASYPSSVNSYVDFGYALLIEGRSESKVTDGYRKYEEAIAQFRRAVELDQRNPAAQFGLGTALYQLSEALPEQKNKKDLRLKAIDALEQAVHWAPHFGDAYIQKARVLRRSGRENDARDADQEAKTQYELLLGRDDSKQARARRILGNLALRSGNRALAIHKYFEAIETDDDYTEAHRAHGLGLFYDGQFDEAVSDLKFVADRRPDDPYQMLWLYLAAAHVAQTPSSTQQQSSTSGSALDNLRKRDSARGARKQVWPDAVIDLFLGNKLEPEEARQAAAKNADFECEASFYIGEWYLLKGDRKAAMDNLDVARRKCRQEFIEYWGAETEFDRLKKNRFAALAKGVQGDRGRGKAVKAEAVKTLEIQLAAE